MNEDSGSSDPNSSPSVSLSDLSDSTYSKRFPIWKDATEEEWNDWRWQLKHAIRTWRQLAEIFPLSPPELRYIREVGDVYPILISPYYVSLIEPDNPDDPVRAQAIPRLEELTEGQELDEDPLDEETDSPVAGLTHRYPDRVLMFTTDFCSTYCRHCTRKRAFRVDIPRPKLPDIDEMIRYVRDHEEVKDVILSGGDPLTLSLSKLEYILSRLREIPHLDIIRLGSRVPVTLPQRLFDRDLLAMLDKYGPIWNNTHFNHPNEVTAEAARAVNNLLHAGIPVNNHAVLLKGVNDDVDTMRTLCRRLLKIKCRPYYLFHCDPVRGAAHFRTSVWKGVEIMEGLRGHISGLGVPTYVVDAPGGGGKIPIMPNYVLSMNDESLVLRNYEGIIVKYYPFGSPGKRVKKNGRNGNGKNGNGNGTQSRPGVVQWEKVGISKLLESDETSLVKVTSPRLERRKSAAPRRKRPPVEAPPDIRP